MSVGALALGAFVIITTETLPVGLLPNIADGLGVSLGLASLLVLVPGLCAAVAAPLFFLGSGQLDRRTVILGLGRLVLASNAIVAVAPNFAVVVAARVLLGAAVGAFWTVVTPVGPKLVGPARGTRAISIIAAGVSAGTVVGLPAGQFFGNLLGWRVTFAAAACAALLIVLAQALLLPRIAADAHPRLSDLTGAATRPAARLGLAASAVVFIGQFSAQTYITPFLLDQAHLSSGNVTVLFLVYGLVGIIGSLFGGSLVSRGVVPTFAGASVAVAAALIALVSVGALSWLVGVLVVLWGLVWGIVPLAAQVWMLDAVPETQEAASAANVTNLQIALAAGSALGGILVDATTPRIVFLTAGATVLAGGALAGLAGRTVKFPSARPPGAPER